MMLHGVCTRVVFTGFLCPISAVVGVGGGFLCPVMLLFCVGDFCVQ